MILGPFDKVGNDQEITGKAHALDDAEFEIEPFLIFGHRYSMGNNSQPILQTGMSLPLELFNLVIGELRQDRCTAICHEGAPLRDFHRVLDRLRQVREQCHHLCG